MTERIKELLQALKNGSPKVTQRQLAERIGVTEGAVSGWVSGRRNITDQSLKAICREFNVNEDWLRTGNGEMFIEADEDEFMKAAALLSNDSFVRNIIVEYYKLDEDSRTLLREFINRLSGGKGEQ